MPSVWCGETPSPISKWSEAVGVEMCLRCAYVADTHEISQCYTSAKIRFAGQCLPTHIYWLPFIKWLLMWCVICASKHFTACVLLLLFHPLWSRIAIWVLVDREIGLCFAIRHLAMSRFWRVWVALIHCGGRRHAFFRVLQGPSQ